MSSPESFGVEQMKPAFEGLATARAVPDWLLELRSAGEVAVTRDGLPTRALESWKYTNLSPLIEGKWEIAEEFAFDDLPGRELFPSWAGASSGEVAVVNGVFVNEWTRVPAGVRVTTANQLESSPVRTAGASALSSTGPISPVWNASTGSPEKQIAQLSLNAAFMRDVIVIEIEPGTILKEPLVISNFSFGTESLTKWSVSAPRIVINVPQGCDIAVVEMSGGQGRTISIPVTHLNVAKGSRVSHARMNMTQASGVQLGYTQVSQARDSFVETYQFSLGGRISREDLEIRLNESGAEAVLDGLYLVDGRRHVDHSTNVEHAAPHTTSSQLYKGILNDESRAVFSGRVRIHRDAQQVSAAQLNNNLLLSKRAEVDTKPELEIDADDVKASHGATIGQIDPEHVFYLRARAIPEAEAVQMLANGFAQDVAFRIRNEAIRLGAGAIVAAKLAGGAHAQI
jgi:Fe-S cluster assembly protein SufD